MIRQTNRADGPDLTATDLDRFPGLSQFETIEPKRRSIVQVPAGYETSPLIVSPYNTPNPGKVLLPGAPAQTNDRTPRHFSMESDQKERRVKPGATVQLDE